MDATLALTEAAGLTDLSPRQRECILLVKDGMSAKEIGRELGISHRTVEIHITAAMERLGVRTRYEAIARLHEETSGKEGPCQVMFAAPPTKLSDYPIVNTASAKPEYEKAEPTSVFPPLGGSPNTANAVQRKRWIGRVTLLTSMITALFTTSILGAYAVFRGLE